MKESVRWSALLALLVWGLCADRLVAQVGEPPDDASVLKGMSLEELMGLEVTSASRAPEPFGQAAAAMQVITHEQIRRSGATTIPEALRLATNLMVARKNSSTWAVTARGFNTDLANKLLVLVDGRTVYTPLFSGVFWDRQDYVLEDIDRIEVIAGPGGALWGANAVNGVINVITRRARDTKGLYASGGVGSQIRGMGEARFGGTVGSRASYRIYGKALSREPEARPDGEDATDAWRRRQGGFRMDADLSSRDGITVQGDLYTGEQDTPDGRTGEATGANTLARFTRTFDEKRELSLQVYYDRTHLLLPTPAQVSGSVTLAPAGTFTDDLDTYDVDFQHRFPAGSRHALVWGGGFRFSHDVVGAGPSLAFDPPTLDHKLFSGFLQDEIALASDLAFTVGTKVERNDYTGFEMEPSARLRWSSEGQMVWGAVSRAVRTPSRVDRDERLPTPGFAPLVTNLLVGNNTFRSETVIAYELGYRGQIGPTVAVSLSTFYNRYDDLRSTSTSPPDPVAHLPFPFYFANALQATTWGGEAVLDWRPFDRVGLRGGYSHLNEDVTVEPGGADFNQALNETADPRHQLFASASADLPGALELDGAFRRIGSFTYNSSGTALTVPAYSELDARLAWRPHRSLELSLEGKNLIHDRHLEYVISPPNPRAEIRRSVEGRVALRW